MTLTVDWNSLLPILLSVAAPTITGFLQQFSIKFSEKAPWYAKSLVTAGFGALITLIANYAANAEASLAAGAIVGALGSMNIALRKGTGRYFDASLEPPVAPARKPE